MRETSRKLITLSKYRRAAEKQSALDVEKEAMEEAAADAIRAAQELRASVMEQVRVALAENGSGQTVNREPLRTDYEERYGI
jgi:hypothetical protein